jgi:hypothetical protein
VIHNYGIVTHTPVTTRYCKDQDGKFSTNTFFGKNLTKYSSTTTFDPRYVCDASDPGTSPFAVYQGEAYPSARNINQTVQLGVQAALILASDGAAGELKMIGEAKVSVTGKTLNIEASNVFLSNLPNPVKSNFERFFSKIPSNSKDYTSIRLSESNDFIFKAISPGRVQGSKAIYEKTVSQSGETINYTKTTIDPKGQIIHVKNKLNK